MGDEQLSEEYMGESPEGMRPYVHSGRKPIGVGPMPMCARSLMPWVGCESSCMGCSMIEVMAMAPGPWDIAWAETGCGWPMVGGKVLPVGGLDDVSLIDR